LLSWLLTAALAQDSARARLDEGWRRVELGDLVGARLIADEAAQRDPDLQAEALYLQGIAWQEARQPADAIPPFRAVIAGWPDAPLAQDARFRMAWAIADAGDPAEALRELRRLPVAKLSGADQAKIRLFEATWTLQRGAWGRGQRAVERAVADPAAASMTWFVAKARLEVLRAALRSASDLDLDGPAPRAAKQLDARAVYVAQADAQLDAIVDTKETGPILDALLRMGAHYEDLANDLAATALPTHLSDEQLAVYRDSVAVRSEQQRIKAIRFWDLGLHLALSTGWQGPERAELQARLDAATAAVESAP
jgi:tetratricopeptide (TPR) repeat protein